MPAPGPDRPWRLELFDSRLDEWVDRDNPPDFQRIAALNWALSRIDDPYRDAQRAEGFDNLWYAVVSDSLDVRGRAAVCSYWIHESTRTLVCDSFAQLGWPV